MSLESDSVDQGTAIHSGRARMVGDRVIIAAATWWAYVSGSTRPSTTKLMGVGDHYPKASHLDKKKVRNARSAALGSTKLEKL